LESIVVADSGVTNLRFAILLRPNGQSDVIDGDVNPGGSEFVTVPSIGFTTGAFDLGGQIEAYRIDSFADGAEQLRVGTTVYTPLNFPAGGIVLSASR
jgi:hypothetical protein